MKVLGLESSCDETAAAIVEEGRGILASVISSQIPVHSPFGGVVPELASREHVDNICFVVERCLVEAGLDWNQLDAVAVTRGPGLMGALLAGMAYAKGLAYALELPFVGINHLEGHIYSVPLDQPEAGFPALSLVVSGGHTSLFYCPRLGQYEEISRTRDDAAGEAFDKLAKHLGLGYPGGPVIDRLAPRGDARSIPFTLPKISDGGLDFSFSGVKTAALRHLQEKGLGPLPLSDRDSPPREILDLVASYQSAIVDQLLDRLQKAIPGRELKSVQISGGVSCNTELQRRGRDCLSAMGIPVFFPPPRLTTDNAAMIAAAATSRLRAGSTDAWDLTAEPNLALAKRPASS